jgi:hypothetical protein
MAMRLKEVQDEEQTLWRDRKFTNICAGSLSVNLYSCVHFVRALHLALFLAGGPFLPSLFVNTYIRALPFAGATRPCVGRARTSRRVPPAGLRCAVSPGPRLRLFRPVSRPVCGFGVSGSASLCVA